MLLGFVLVLSFSLLTTLLHIIVSVLGNERLMFAVLIEESSFFQIEIKSVIGAGNYILC